MSAARKSQTQIALEQLKRLIVENELQADTNHLESELSTKLGMSRTPIREATLILEAQGLLKVIPRHGVKIRALSPDDMGEIYQILTELEGLSAELAAQKDLSESDLKVVKASIEEMAEALSRDDREAWAVADETFHNELVRLGGNKRIASIVDMYNDQVRRIRSVTLYLRPSPMQSIDDHRNLLDAIIKGDPVAARKIHTEHRNRARILLTELLRKYGFR